MALVHLVYEHWIITCILVVVVVLSVGVAINIAKN